MATKQRAYSPAGAAAVAAGVFFWGIGVVFVKLTSVPFLIVSFYRHVFAVPVLFVLWLAARDRSLPWRAAAFGGVLFAGHQLLNFSALRYSTAAVVTILFSLQPLIVGAFAGRYVGEHSTGSFYLWSIVAVAGCSVVVFASTGEATTSPLGVALAVGNLVVWCAYYLMSKRARESASALGWNVVMIAVSTAIIGSITLVARQPLGSPDGREWVYLVCLAVISGTFGHVFVTWAHPRIHVSASSAIVLGVPIVGTVGTAIFADEPFGVWQAVGGLVALGATVAAMRTLPPPIAAEAVHVGEVGS